MMLSRRHIDPGVRGWARQVAPGRGIVADATWRDRGGTTYNLLDTAETVQAGGDPAMRL